MKELMQAHNLQTWSLIDIVLDSLILCCVPFPDTLAATTVAFSKYQIHSAKLLKRPRAFLYLIRQESKFEWEKERNKTYCSLKSSKKYFYLSWCRGRGDFLTLLLIPGLFIEYLL